MKRVATKSLKLSPDADRIPQMDADQEQAFRSDIAARGIKVPIEVVNDNMIVDGRSRWLAACALGLDEVPIVEIDLNGESAFLYMLRAATKRRHFTADQLACLAMEEMEYLATLSRRQRATTAGLAGGRGRPQSETDSSAVDVAAGQTRDRSSDARTVAAKRYGVSERKLREAQLIRRHSPVIYQEVLTGGSRLAEARCEVQRDHKRQQLQQQTRAASDAKVLWAIRSGDCIEELRQLEAGSARLVFADPPYNIGIDYGDGADSDRLADADFLDWSRRWMSECVRALSEDGSLWVMINDEYADYFGVILRELGLHRRSWIKWYETFGVNCTNNFNRCSRHIFYCVKDPSQFIFDDEAVRRPSARLSEYQDPRANPAGKLWDNVWQIPRLVGNSDERQPDFPTQLPLALVEPIIRCASLPGDLVVDPFSGSATTGVAATGCGRRYLGIERNPDYARKSEQRLAAAAS